jgi:2-polyprenyl-3-methyl-5-hydroxy-6-metoxy-1,4-benzoquinol methylase
MNRLASWLGQDKSLQILDFGCGPGAFLAFLRDKFGFAHVEGLELSRDSVVFARQQYGLTVAATTAELRQPSYDCVILIEVIEHLPDPGAFFAQVAELVRPGGRVLITTPAVDNVYGRFLPSLCMHYTAPSHISLFTKAGDDGTVVASRVRDRTPRNGHDLPIIGQGGCRSRARLRFCQSSS